MSEKKEDILNTEGPEKEEEGKSEKLALKDRVLEVCRNLYVRIGGASLLFLIYVLFVVAAARGQIEKQNSFLIDDILMRDTRVAGVRAFADLSQLSSEVEPLVRIINSDETMDTAELLRIAKGSALVKEAAVVDRTALIDDGESKPTSIISSSISTQRGHAQSGERTCLGKDAVAKDRLHHTTRQRAASRTFLWSGQRLMNENIEDFFLTICILQQLNQKICSQAVLWRKSTTVVDDIPHSIRVLTHLFADESHNAIVVLPTASSPSVIDMIRVIKNRLRLHVAAENKHGRNNFT